MRRIPAIVAGALALVLAACDTTAPSLHEAEIVVEAYLVAGEDLPPVRVSTTSDINGSYDAEERAVLNATVVVRRLGESNAASAGFAYAPDPARKGVYVPDRPEKTRPLATYALEVSIPGRETVTARTLVPGTFDLRNGELTPLPYRGPRQFEIEMTRSSYPGRQNIFVFSLRSLAPDILNLTPLYLDIVYGIKQDEAFDPADLESAKLTPYLTNASPPTNEENFDLNADGTVTIRLPWFIFAFYGQNRLSVNAIDDALYDFMRSQQVQTGGSTLSPGEIPDILDHVENGRGVFGSLASVAVDVELTR